MSIASLGASASAALSHALGHPHAHKPQQAGSMADLLAQLTGGSTQAGGGVASAAGKVGQDLLEMLGVSQKEAQSPAKAAAAYGAGSGLTPPT